MYLYSLTRLHRAVLNYAHKQFYFYLYFLLNNNNVARKHYFGESSSLNWNHITPEYEAEDTVGNTLLSKFLHGAESFL